MSELAVGRIVRVAEHPGARAPSWLLEIDLGAHGRHEAPLARGGYGPAELEGRQVLVRREADGEVTVVGAHSHARGLVLLRPDGDVEEGAVVD